jgi:hypothetical protein
MSYGTDTSNAAVIDLGAMRGYAGQRERKEERHDSAVIDLGAMRGSFEYNKPLEGDDEPEPLSQVLPLCTGELESGWFREACPVESQDSIDMRLIAAAKEKTQMQRDFRATKGPIGRFLYDIYCHFEKAKNGGYFGL